MSLNFKRKFKKKIFNSDTPCEVLFVHIATSLDSMKLPKQTFKMNFLPSNSKLRLYLTGFLVNVISLILFNHRTNGLEVLNYISVNFFSPPLPPQF